MQHPISQTALYPSYPIGTPGQAWGDAERTQWQQRQTRHRSYAADVLAPLQALTAASSSPWQLEQYGQLQYAEELFPLQALRSKQPTTGLPWVLVTGGVHGYETSGVHGALRFAQLWAQGHADLAAYTHRFNLLVAPCVSPWAYERIQRWNHHAVDPNRAFRAAGQPSPAAEAAALMQLVAPLHGQWLAHIDLHETTDTDESEFRPAFAARDGQRFEPAQVPDGFYLVDDSQNPQPAFQQAILRAVEQVTHIAQADASGGLFGTPLAAPGVIEYDVGPMGLCTSITGARYTSATEVYPDSPRATPEQCIAAQVAAVCGALGFLANT
ncbi:M14 family metallocarboxypeptidase [Curvibacter sp. CHRR-16]|uniref:M14 family metallopeptidase n=1 Tax=Curvibacter sp. CHRR-16 TaxID=2835872 RepID=UPI001BDAB322|nr:M14 family metallocarboxypeptidase [Curvibacter sp. CHRR-16]MBT0570966.1 M14 family metallocarboxypeptidase [Curvibacter sp. CHRR-16]